MDVVSSVIDKNKVKFNDLEWMKFSSQDLSSWTENLPNGYDLILSRDALQHLSYSSIAGRSYQGNFHRTFIDTNTQYLYRCTFQVLSHRLKISSGRIIS